MSTFRVVIVSSHNPDLIHDYYCYGSFIKSCERQGVEPLNLGYMGFNGLISKPKNLLRAIHEGIIAEDIIIAVDSWDLIFVRPITEMIELYNQGNYGVIFSTEINCFPGTHKEGMDAMGQGYLNSGFIMGKREEVKGMLEAMELHNIKDDHHDGTQMVHTLDQTDYQAIYLKQPVKITLDTNSVFCQSLYGIMMDDMLLEKGEVRIKKTNNHPFVLHWNGGAKTLSGSMKPILQYLNML